MKLHVIVVLIVAIDVYLIEGSEKVYTFRKPDLSSENLINKAGSKLASKANAKILKKSGINVADYKPSKEQCLKTCAYASEKKNKKCAKKCNRYDIITGGGGKGSGKRSGNYNDGGSDSGSDGGSYGGSYGGNNQVSHNGNHNGNHNGLNQGSHGGNHEAINQGSHGGNHEAINQGSHGGSENVREGQESEIQHGNNPQ